VFWAVTIAISLLPIAAEFRAAFKISYIDVVLFDTLLGGLIFGCYVSFFLLRFFDKIPTKNPILKSLILSSIAYVAVIILLLVASNYIRDNGSYYFLIGAILNLPRFLIFGAAIGYPI
jgi:hypothetical protein